MKFIKLHWFELLIGVWLMGFALLLTLILLAPKHDLKNRGFTYCTQVLISDLQECDRAFFCSSKAVAQSTWCDIKIVAQGLKLWHDGKQPYPWSNYIFTPETVNSVLFDDIEDEEIAAYLKANPDSTDKIQEFIKLRKDLDNVEKEKSRQHTKISPQNSTSGMGLE